MFLNKKSVLFGFAFDNTPLAPLKGGINPWCERPWLLRN